MKKKSIGIHLFRRDLRIEDNVSLNNALIECDEVICIFIFDSRQKEHEYFSYNGFDFMLESLEELRIQLEKKRGRLLFLKGNITGILKKIIKESNVKSIYFNEDYTPFSKKRDESIKELCHKIKVECKTYRDSILSNPNDIRNSSNTPYTIFTPFFNSLKKISIDEPTTEKGKCSSFKSKLELDKMPSKYNISKKRYLLGGRKEALKILDKIKKYDKYNEKRDYPILDSTTKLSPHLKFGTISPREAYTIISLQLGEEHPLIRQLAWREFYYHIAIHYPHVFGKEFRKEYSDIEWEYDDKKLELWKKGQTGFPIVDAGMRELLETGYMHNRVRMITASFLTKDLHIDWRLGEKHFANYLVDYDPCINNGNWQWAASTGCDAQPYFRIFNPWLQQTKFDEKAEYIKKWIPELEYYDTTKIHSWDKNHDNKKYPKPILKHDEERKIALERFKKEK